MTAPDEPDYVTATRAAYDTVAADYARLLAGALDGNPFDRAALGLFADLVAGMADTADTADGTGGAGAPADTRRVADIGCGPGHITAHLAKLGLDAFGVDLSPGMVAEARLRHPGLEFRVGDMTALDLPPSSLAGLVAWYSVIHVPPAGHPAVFEGFRRVLAPGGHLLLAFQVGDERRHLTEAYGHGGLSCDAYRLPIDRVQQDAETAGFVPVARLVNEPFGTQKTPQAHLVLRAG